ncbi:NADP-dependent 3-hydroxy acid dehydrogenase YdfG [Promicromonospora sp. AC04]|uniref:SDR family NAD(P)-dependent oxidoreductase n=1 Tax=Promicromonospora sp. AC04 TaxID=2135723 RepID=UPI000D35A1E6|nr:SDR family oxidoreductase [Promicromonospora sp. AC04]PUB20807.1 NADP-dependent 3-hydroxy acid dehydrogenase YdfG [Promicromonospora sp. AC04]
MSANLSGKVAIVTGAGSDVGRASALALAEAGARVVVADLLVEEAQETVALIGSGDAHFVQTDVSDPESVARLVAATVERFRRLDIAHNHADVLGRTAQLDEVSFEEWTRVVGVNLGGVFNGLHAQIPAMRESGGGSIINTASVIGPFSLPNHGPYVAAKYGVIGLTKAAALETADDNIRVNSLEMAGPSAQPDPAAIARAVLWLASDESAAVHGSSLVVDGGLLADV